MMIEHYDTILISRFYIQILFKQKVCIIRRNKKNQPLTETV